MSEQADERPEKAFRRQIDAGKSPSTQALQPWELNELAFRIGEMPDQAYEYSYSDSGLNLRSAGIDVSTRAKEPAPEATTQGADVEWVTGEVAAIAALRNEAARRHWGPVS